MMDETEIEVVETVTEDSAETPAPQPPTPLKVHVTRLEMAAPPKVFLPVPVNLQTALMRAVTIPLSYYRYLYQQVGHRWHWVDRLRMSDEELTAVLHNEKNSITVLYVNGAPCGFYELLQVADGDVELSHFGLMDSALGLGIGKWFLLQALYAAWTTNPLKVTVTTNTLDHPRALQLYQRFGFSPVAVEETELTPLSEDELLTISRRNLDI